jgi:hypothetical protein
VRTDEDVREQIHPSRVTELVVVGFSAAVVVVVYWADHRYRRWAKENSLLAGPRVRAAAVKSNYRRKRSRAAGAIRTVGEILVAAEIVRAIAKASASSNGEHDQP